MKINKGISLVVLVITIIITTILAGAVILNLSNNNPIDKATEATFKTNVAAYNSELAIVVTNQYSPSYSFGTGLLNAGVWDGTDVNISGTIKEYITSITVIDGARFEIQNSKLVYVGDNQKEKDYVTEMELLNKFELGTNVIAPVNATVNGRIYSYKNPIIPKGFKAINDGAVWPTDWNTGLVIEDVAGNQFVWVPVDGTNVKYEKWDGAVTYVSVSVTTNDTLPTGINSETNQITNYGGFYIARYEAGKENTTILVSKKLTTIWNNINYINSKIKSEAMYTTAEVKSGLVTGTQWDTILKWFQNKGVNVSSDSSSWGNYNNSTAPANVAGYGIKQLTGYSEYWKVNNIYDIAGNTWEWTNEIYYSVRVGRGGYSGDTSIYYPAGARAGATITNIFTNGSFRVVLYIL